MARRAWATAGLAGLLLGISHAANAESAFKFVRPPGWTDLMPGTPDFGRLPEPARQAIESNHFVAYAGDLDSAASGFMSNLNVLVFPGSGRIGEKDMDEFAKQLNVPNYVVTEKKLVEAGKVTVGRLRGTLTVGGRQIGQVAYLLPGHDEIAVMVFSVPVEKIEAQLPVFETAALATEGLYQPPGLLDNVIPAAITGGVIGGILGLFKLVHGKRKK